MNSSPTPSRAGQTGAVLITAVIFMIVLTIFVLALVRGGTLEERMARNARDQQVAREAAEAVLRDAENTLFTLAPFDPYDQTKFGPGCPEGLCFQPTAAMKWDKINWKSSSVTKTFQGAGKEIDLVTNQPRFIVEIIKAPKRSAGSGTPCSDGLARVTARGEGNGGAVAVIQSVTRFRVFSKICD